MKTIKKINAFAIGLPLFLLLTFIFNAERAWALALLSTIITGFLQVLIGIKMHMFPEYKKQISIYLISVIIYFVFFLFYFNFNGSLRNSIYLVAGIPIVLAIYLTVIIHKPIPKL